MTSAFKMRADRISSVHSIALALLLSVFAANTASLATAQQRTIRPAAPSSRGSENSVRVIVSGSPTEVQSLAQRYGGHVTRQLQYGGAVEIPGARLAAMRRDASETQISEDVIVRSSMDVTTSAIGADQAWSGLAGLGSVTGDGVGVGVGVAIIDSGVFAEHPDLGHRVIASRNFAEGGISGKDGHGHGTHVAGIVARVAPNAHILDLRVLNSEGWGHSSAVIEAIEFAIENREKFGIRVANLSLGSRPQSFRTSPLAQAVEKAVAAGIVVVCSAGNFGRSEDGLKVFGGVTSPGNTPSALTIGAVNTFGTAARFDDEVTTYSSRGPTAQDHVLKPDLVAPGNKLVSLLAPASYLERNYPERRASGDYFTLSGTSMSAAVVSGAVTLLLESSPSLTPRQVKIALQSAASPIPGAGLVEAGAGSLNVVRSLYIGAFGPTASLPQIRIARAETESTGIVFFARASPPTQNTNTAEQGAAGLKEMALQRNVILWLNSPTRQSRRDSVPADPIAPTYSWKPHTDRPGAPAQREMDLRTNPASGVDGILGPYGAIDTADGPGSPTETTTYRDCD